MKNKSASVKLILLIIFGVIILAGLVIIGISVVDDFSSPKAPQAAGNLGVVPVSPIDAPSTKPAESPCGNGMCEDGESCSTCPSDCGNCSSLSSSSHHRSSGCEENGCSTLGIFCAGNSVYSCSIGLDGCYQQVNGESCTEGKSCIVGVGCGNEQQVFRLYNMLLNEYLYTTNETEKNDELDFGYSGMGNLGNILTTQPDGATPLYVLYSDDNYDYILTANDTEKNDAIKNGYEDKGVLGYVLENSGQGRKEIFALWNDGTGKHFYTTDESEKNSYLDKGWSYLGIAGYLPSA
jgi:hypothetical protein